MNSIPSVRRVLSAGITALVFGGVVAAVALSGRSAATDTGDGDTSNAATKHVWPMWGGTVQRNMVNTREKNLPVKWTATENKQENVKWSVKLGSKAYAGPVIADGKIFVGTNNDSPRDPKIKGDKGILYCLEEATGKFLWQAVHDKLESGLVNDWPREGICSTPAIDGNRLYYVSNRCQVVCADVEGLGNGKNLGVKDEKYTGPGKADIIWHLDMMPELNVFPHNLSTSSPVVVGDTVFAVTSNGVDEGHTNIPSPKAPSFVAVNKKTGKVIWKSNAPGKAIMHGQWSSPCYAEVNGTPQVIFPGGDGYLRAFTPDKGQLIWKFFCNPWNSKYELGGKGTRSDFLATPVVADNRCYIGVGQDPEHEEGVGHLWCIDLEKATRLGPKAENNDVSAELLVDAAADAPKTKPNPNSAVGWHYGGPIQDPAEQEKLGRNYFFGRTLSTCAVHDGLVYAAELAGRLHCLDAKTGKHYWDHDMGSACWSSPYWVDGKVYIGNDGDNVLVFKAGKTKELLAENEMNGQVRATVTAANGVVYVMTENTLYAIK
jgi:outer membrane protein assembly factor BamB